MTTNDYNLSLLQPGEISDLVWPVCQTKSELDDWLRGVLGVFLAKKAIVKGNSSPLDFLWDCYASALHGKQMTLQNGQTITLNLIDKPSYDVVGIAGRGSQKSLTCGVLEFLLLLHDPDRDLFHMASIREQSKVTYRYIKSFINKQHLNGSVLRTIESQTEGLFGNILQVGTGTMDSVNSFHGSVIQDECDLTDRVVFQESSGMLSPTKDGRMPLNVAISSRKFAFGNVQNMIDSEHEKDLKIHRWGLLENTQNCSDNRSGTKVTNIWVNEEALIHLSNKDYGELAEGEYKDKFVKIKGFNSCVNCPIFSFCQTRLKEQDTDNPHLIPIDLAIKYFKREDSEFFKAQRLNLKPSRKGLVYPQYSEAIHVRNYSQMWEVFFGTAALSKDGKPINVTRKMLIDAMRKRGCERYIAVDFGFNMGHMLLIFVDGSDNIYVVDEIVTEQKSDAEMAKIAWEAWGPYGIDLVYPDIASPGGMKEFEEIGFPVSKDVKKTKEETTAGFGTVRKLLQIPGTLDTKMLISYECNVFREQMALYHYVIDKKTDEPTDRVAKENDHGCDAYRYFAHTRFGQEEVRIITSKPGLSSRPKNLVGVPSPEELAAFAGVAIIDNRNDSQINNKNNDNDDDDDNNSGGMQFTFA